MGYMGTVLHAFESRPTRTASAGAVWTAPGGVRTPEGSGPECSGSRQLLFMDPDKIEYFIFH